MRSSAADDRRAVVLRGGTANRDRVVRIGDTVRRPTRPTQPATAALLGYLESVGFEGVPRHLGLDGEGREVLSYLPGEAVVPPYPAWAMTDEALVSVARLLRRFHEALDGFDPAPHVWPGPVPARYRTSLVTHNDPNLDNIVFRDGRAVGLIDFDLAAPGSRVWEVAAAARFWAPLREACDVDDARRGARLVRLRRFVDAYGLDDHERDGFVDAVLANHDWLYGIVREAAESGHAAFAGYWDEGGSARADRSRRWTVAHADEVRRALG